MDKQDLGVHERIAKLEYMTDKHEEVIKMFIQKNENQVEINTLFKQQIETNKEQTKQMKELSNTLININQNLAHLNANQHQLSERVTDIEQTLQDNRVDKTKIIISILRYIGGFATSILLAYLLFKWGIRQ